eukprot:329806-Pleurochrysis_carterae.AAC.2
MFAFSAIEEASHGLESAATPAFDLLFPGESPNKDELKQGMLRGQLPYAALALAPRSLEEIPPIADAASRTKATRAALRAQVNYENTTKQEAREAL